MKKRQKLILIIYSCFVLFLGFLYVPYTSYYPGCVQRFEGHHLRASFTNFIGIRHWAKGLTFGATIDSTMIIAEIFVLSAFTCAAILLFKEKEKTTYKIDSPF